MAKECNISFGSCQGILTEKLHMRQVAAKFVSRIKNNEEFKFLKNFFKWQMTMKTLRTIITGDETWVYVYNVETNTQSSQWKTHTSP
jgi:hypothetical protein